MNFGNKCKTVISLGMATLCLPIVSVSAKENFTVKSISSKEKIVQSVLSDTMTASDIVVNGNSDGQIGSFKNGKDNVGIDEGLVLSTGYVSSILNSSKRGSDEVHCYNKTDKDLKKMTNYSMYDLASVEFTLTNNENYNTVLSFNYSFGSAEFDQPNIYNDCFGLFVDYNNDGVYDENIAKLPNGKNSSIMNIKYGKYFIGSAGKKYKDSFNGISNVFTAQTSKQIPKGGKVRLKLAIADCSDAIYNSAVFIEGKSVNLGKKIENPVISGTNMPNGKLTPTFNDAETTCTYQWYLADEKGKEGKMLPNETDEKLEVTKDMVGKYAYLVVTGTCDYSGTGISNYMQIVDLPLNQQRFSYYTNFHYDEPYNLTCYGKGKNLDMYYLVTEENKTPTPKEMITGGTKVNCNKTITKNGNTYSGGEISGELYIKNLKNHIYVMFAREESDKIVHSGIKDRQLYPMFSNAEKLGFNSKEINVCNKIVKLYDTMFKNSITLSETVGNKIENPLNDKNINLCENISDKVSLKCSDCLSFKMEGKVEKTCKDYGYVVYNCNNGDLKDLGYNKKNIPCGKDLLKINGVEVYSLNNLTEKENTVVTYNKGLKANTMNTDYIFAFWYIDENDNMVMEKSFYENSYELALQEISVKAKDADVLKAYVDLYNALENLCK